MDTSRHMTKTDNIPRTIPFNIVSVGLIRHGRSCSLRYTCHSIEEPFFPFHLINVLDLAVPNGVHQRGVATPEVKEV
jgi:hypothetical protein